jgi:hypothetical protein
VVFATGAEVSMDPSYYYGYGGTQKVHDMGIGWTLDGLARSLCC